ARGEHLPDLDRLREPFQLQGAKLAKLEQIANQAARSRGDDDRAGLSQGLQPGGKIWSLPDHGLLLRCAFPDEVTYDHDPSCDPDARLKLDGFEIETTYSIDDAQPGTHRPLSIVLMRPRIAKIDENAVAHVLRDKAIPPGDDASNGAVIGCDDLAQILGIEARREFCRPHQIAEHHRQLSAFGRGGWHRRVRNNIAPQRCDRSKQLAAVPDKADADVL